MAGIADMLISGFNQGTALRQNREAEERQSKLASLYSSALSGGDRSAILPQMAAIDPEAAMRADQAFNQQEDRRAGKLREHARLLASLPPQMRPQAYASMVPELQQMGLGDGLPPQWSDELMPTVEAIANSGQSQSVPAGFDAAHRTLIAAGFQPGTPEYERGMRIEAGLEPGFGKSAPRSLNVDINGTPTQVTFDPTTGQYIQANLGGQPQPMAPQPQGGGDPFAGLMASVPNLRVTSRTRTPEENAALPNSVPNSYHLTGQAIDIGRPDPQQRQAINQWASQNGYEVIDNYADGHVHLEPRPGTPIIGRRKEDEAAAVEAAKVGVQLDALPAELGIRNQAAIEQTRGTEQAKADIEREQGEPARQEKVRQTLAKTANLTRTIDDAIGRVNGMTAGFIGSIADEIPGTPANDLRVTVNTIKANLAFDALQAMREASPTGGALGAVSERELALLESAVASLDQSQTPAQMRDALGRVKQHYQAWEQAVRQADREAGGRVQSAPSGVDDLLSKYGVQ